MTRNTRTTSAKAAGSMKDVGRSGGSVTVNRNYGSTKALYSSRAKEKEEEEKEKKNSGSAAQKSTAPAFTRNDSRETRESQQHSYGGSSEVRQDKAPATSSVKSMYNSDWMSRPEDSSRYTFESHSDKKDEDKVDVGQLAFGVVDQAADQLIGNAVGAVDMLIGTPYQKALDYAEQRFGLPDTGVNGISALNKRLQESAARDAEIYARNASKSELARLINEYGPDVLAMIPEIALAFASGGTSAAASAGMKGLKVASKADDIADAMKIAVRWVKNNPAVANNFLQTSGNAYNQALSEGANESQARNYAITNGMLNLTLNGVGLAKGQAGVESLAGNLKNADNFLKYIGEYDKAILHDGLENVVQGVAQRASRGIYDEDIKLLSENPNAVLNPRAVLTDLAMGAAVPATMSGVHAGTKAIEASAANSVSRMQSFRYMDELMKANAGMDKDYALKQAQLLQRVTNGMVLDPDELRELDMKNEAIQKFFTQKTGIAFSAMDNSRPDTLRQKFQTGAIKAKKGDIRVENTPQNVLATWWDERYNKGAKVAARENSELKHGDWRNTNIKTDGSQLAKVGRRKTLQQDTAYAAGENNYIYKTDTIGRPKNVTGVLLPKPEGKERGGHYKNTPEKQKGYDDAGHILADRFGGSPDLDNLLSQWSKINRSGGEYYKLEETWAKALDEGKEVYVDFDIHYPDNSKRPDWYDITYYIDGEYTSKRIFNPLKD